MKRIFRKPQVYGFRLENCILLINNQIQVYIKISQNIEYVDSGWEDKHQAPSAKFKWMRNGLEKWQQIFSVEFFITVGWNK